MHNDVSASELTFQIDGLIALRGDAVHLCGIDGHHLVALVPLLSNGCLLAIIAFIGHALGAVDGHDHVASLPFRHTVQELP